MKPEIEELVRKALELNERDRAEVAARLVGGTEEEEDMDASHGSRSRTPQELKRFETKVFDLGPCRLEDLDDVAKVLANLNPAASSRRRNSSPVRSRPPNSTSIAMSARAMA